MNQKQRDTLCKLLRAEADKTKKLLPGKFPMIDRYGNIIHIYMQESERNKQLMDSMPQSLRKTYDQLSKRHNVLKKQEAKLNGEFSVWQKKAQLYGQSQRQALSAAKEQLESAFDQALINIQFADNADEARTILESLPNIDQLL